MKRGVKVRRQVVGDDGMNRTERAYAAYLAILKAAGEIRDYQHEPIKLRLADRTYYTPDFAVILPDGTYELHEVKAARKDRASGTRKPLFEDDARVKIKVAAELHPFAFVAAWPDGAGGWQQERFE